MQNVVGSTDAHGQGSKVGLPGMGFPKGAGELVQVEDDATLDRKKWYNVVLGSIILVSGVAVMAASTLVLVLAGEGMADGDPLGVIVGFFLIGGLVTFVAGTYFYIKSINQRNLQFFDNGIAHIVRYRKRGWRFEHRPWSKMGTYARKDHWFLGPSIVVDIGIPGEGLLVPGTMKGFDQVYQLISQNLEQRM